MSLIYFDSKRITTKALKPYQNTLRKLLDRPTGHGLHCEKLRGADNIYSIRDNKKGRLLFTIKQIDGQPCYIILEILAKHEYDRSLYLRGLVTTASLDDTAFEAINLDDAQVPVPAPISKRQPSLQLTEIDISIYNQQLIILTNEQQQVLHQRLPLALQGGPGTGKTCLASEILQQTSRSADQKLLYLSKSAKLVSRFQAQFQLLEQESAVEFTTYQELLTKLSPRHNRSAIVDKSEFDCFIKSKSRIKPFELKTQLPATELADMLYQEIRIISGFDDEAAYLTLGQRQCLFESKLRPQVWALYQAYQAYLAHEDKVDCAILPLLDEVAPNQYDVIVVDEAQDLSFGQLRALTALAKDNQVCFLLDANQRLFDVVSHANYLRTTLNVSFCTLEQSFRCPRNIVELANTVLDYKNHFPSLLRGKKESQPTASGLDEDGELRWLPVPKASCPSLPDDIRALAATPELAVITPEEYKEEASEIIGSALVFTPAEIKGLEYPYIVLHRPFDSDPYAHINQTIKKKEHKKSKPRSTSPTAIEQALKETFVSCTRAQKGLFIVNDSHHHSHNLLSQLQQTHSKSLTPAQTATVPASSTLSPEDWYIEISRLFNNGNDDQALRAIQLHINNHQAFKTWLLKNHQYKVSQWLSSQTQDRKLQLLYKPNSRQPTFSQPLQASALPFFTNPEANLASTSAQAALASPATSLPPKLLDKETALTMKEALPSSSVLTPHQRILKATTNKTLIEAIRDLITPIIKDQTRFNDVYQSIFKSTVDSSESFFERLSKTDAFGKLFSILKKSEAKPLPVKSKSKRKNHRPKRGKKSKQNHTPQKAQAKNIFTDIERTTLLALFRKCLADESVNNRPSSLAALLLSGLYQNSNAGFDALKMQHPLLSSFQGEQLKRKTTIEELAHIIEEHYASEPLEHLESYMLSLLCQRGADTIYKHLPESKLLTPEAMKLLSQEVESGIASDDFALNILLRAPETHALILENKNLSHKLLSSSGLNKISNNDEYLDSSPLFWLLYNANGRKFFINHYPLLKKHINTETLNQAASCDGLAGMSPLYCLAQEFNGSKFIIKNWKSLKNKVTKAGLNQPILDGDNQGMSVLYHLSRTHEGANFIIHNWPSIQSKVTHKGLSQAIRCGVTEGTCALFWLIDSPNGPRFLIDNWSYLEEGVPLGPSPLYWLIANPNGRDFFINHWLDFEDKVTAKSLCQAVPTGPAEGASPLFWLMTSDKGQAFFLDNWTQLKHKVTLAGLNQMVQATGCYQGTSPLYWLTNNARGRLFLLRNWAQFEPQDGNGIGLLYWLTTNPEARKCLINSWHHLKDKISPSAFTNIIEAGVHQGISPLFWLVNDDSSRPFVLENWDYFNQGQEQGLGIIYWLSASPNGRQFMMTFWQTLKNKITRKVLNKVVESGKAADTSPLYWLAKYPESREFIIDNWPKFRELVTIAGLTHIIQTEKDPGTSALYWFADSPFSQNFLIDNWHYLNQGEKNGTGLLYWLTANPHGQNFLIMSWSHLKDYITPASWQQTIADGEMAGVGPLFWLSKSNLGQRFIIEHWHELQQFIEPQSFNRIVKAGPYQSASALYWFLENNIGHQFVISNWSYFDRGSIDGVSALFWLTASAKGRKLLIQHWHWFEEEITAETFNQPVLANISAGQSPLLRFMSSENGREFLIRNWPKLKTKVTLEGLNRVPHDYNFSNVSPLCWLLACSGGRQIFIRYWSDFKSLISSEGLCQLIKHGEHQGKSPLFWLLADEQGRQHVMNNWHDFKVLITKEAFNHPAEYGLATGTNPLFLMCAEPNSCRFISNHWHDFKTLISQQGLHQVVQHGQHKGKCSLSWIRRYSCISNMPFFNTADTSQTTESTPLPISKLRL